MRIACGRCEESWRSPMKIMPKQRGAGTLSLPAGGLNITLPLLGLAALAVIGGMLHFKPSGLIPWWLSVLLAIGVRAGIHFGVFRLWGMEYFASPGYFKRRASLSFLLFFVFFFSLGRGVGVVMTGLSGAKYVETRHVEVRMRQRRGKNSECRYYIADDIDVDECISADQYQRFQGQWIDVRISGKRSSWGTRIDSIVFPS